MIISLLLLMLLFPFTASAMQISEVYPAPINGDFEWVEVVNTTKASVQLDAYYLEDESGKKILFTDTVLDPDEFTVATTSSVLNNNGDTVSLKQTDGLLIDSVQYTDTLTSTQSYALCSDTSTWITTKIQTQGAQNDLLCTPTAIPSPSITPSPSSSPIPVLSSHVTPKKEIEHIMISEVYPYPNPNEQEWVELYNNSDQTQELVNWQIDDTLDSGASPLSFSTTIAPYSHTQIHLSKHMLNNGGDTVRLLNPDGILITEISYSTIQKGKSFGTNPANALSFCIMEPSPETQNNECSESIPESDSDQNETGANTSIEPTSSDKATLSTGLYSARNTTIPFRKPNPVFTNHKPVSDTRSHANHFTFLSNEINSSILFVFLGSFIFFVTGCGRILYRLYQREFSSNWQLKEIPLY